VNILRDEEHTGARLYEVSRYRNSMDNRKKKKEKQMHGAILSAIEGAMIGGGFR